MFSVKSPNKILHLSRGAARRVGLETDAKIKPIMDVLTLRALELENLKCAGARRIISAGIVGRQSNSMQKMPHVLTAFVYSFIASTYKALGGKSKFLLVRLKTYLSWLYLKWRK
jgi:hypothetical protein